MSLLTVAGFHVNEEDGRWANGVVSGLLLEAMSKTMNTPKIYIHCKTLQGILQSMYGLYYGLNNRKSVVRFTRTTHFPLFQSTQTVGPTDTKSYTKVTIKTYQFISVM
jgi:hypothetical protein